MFFRSNFATPPSGFSDEKWSSDSSNASPHISNRIDLSHSVTQIDAIDYSIEEISPHGNRFCDSNDDDGLLRNGICTDLAHTDFSSNRQNSSAMNIHQDEHHATAWQTLYSGEPCLFLDEPTFMFSELQFSDQPFHPDTCLTPRPFEEVSRRGREVCPSPLVCMAPPGPNSPSPRPNTPSFRTQSAVCSKSPEVQSASHSSRPPTGPLPIKRRSANPLGSPLINRTPHRSPVISPSSRPPPRSITNPIIRSDLTAQSSSQRRSLGPRDLGQRNLGHRDYSATPSNLRDDDLRRRHSTDSSETRRPSHLDRKATPPVGVDQSSVHQRRRQSSVPKVLQSSQIASQNNIAPASKLRYPRQNLSQSSTQSSKSNSNNVKRLSGSPDPHQMSRNGKAHKLSKQPEPDNTNNQRGNQLPLSLFESSIISGLQSGMFDFQPHTHQKYTEELIKRRAKFRESLDSIVMTFNRTGVKEALQLLGEHKLIDPKAPASVASFLFFVPGLDKREVSPNNKSIIKFNPFNTVSNFDSKLT